MNPFETTTLDVDRIGRRNADTIVSLLKMTLLSPSGEMPDDAEAHAFMKNVMDGLKDTAQLIGEVKRLREQRQRLRDIHAPANSNDPASPGAICTGCSLHGSLVAWPCPSWNATEDGR